MPRRKRQQHNQEEETDEDESFEEDTECSSASTTSLYEVLGVERTATHDEIRKAYHKLALRLHPDKNPGDQNAKEKFQFLQNVMAILGDPAKRKVYDETGSTEDAELSSETLQNLYEFFRMQHKKVTEKDIEEFAASYRGSENEKQDLKELYNKCKGNMDRVFDRLMCSIPQQDSHRFMDIISEAVSAGELKKYEMYKKWAAKVVKKPRPSDPLKPPKKSKKSDKPADSSLTAIISSCEKQRMDSLTAMLEAKYAGKGKSKNSTAEPSEEEFEAARQRLSQRMNGKHK